MEPYDEAVEWALTHNAEPADEVAALTRSPQNPMRPSPEQAGCIHPLETIKWNAYYQVMECGECGAWILIEDLQN